MPSLVKFFGGIGAGFLLGALGYFLLFRLQLGAPLHGTAFNAAVIRLKKEQASAVSSPKILLVGGSSVGNGLSARTVETALGVPCYNYSFWASLGGEYFLHQAKVVLKPHDCVVLCLEYEVLDWSGRGNRWLNPDFLRFVAATDPGFIRDKSLGDQIRMAYSLPPTAILSGLLAWGKGSETQPETFNGNRWGDTVTNTKERRPQNASYRTAPNGAFLSGLSRSPKGFDAIREFSGWAKAHGVRIVATFPNLAMNRAYTDERILTVENIIRGGYAEMGIPVVGTIRSAMFDADDYFDSNYHLTDKSAVRRTELLLPELKEVLVDWQPPSQ